MKLLHTPGARRLVCAAAGIATVVAISACAGPANGSEDSVKIGLLANLTGGASTSFGIPFEQGFELALDEAKAQLDDAGVTVEVVTEDAKSAVPTAVTGYNKLRQEGVALVVQDSQSPLGQAVAPLANEDGIALLSGAGSSLENPDGYAFRFTDLATPTAAVGTYLADQGAGRIGVVVAGDNPSFASLAEATEKGLPTGFASRQEVSSQDSDFSAVLANLRRDRVDAVVLSVLPAQAGNLLLQASQSGGLDGVKLVGTLATSSETFTVAQDAARGFEFPQVWAPSISGDSTFQRRYTEQYGETHGLWSSRVPGRLDCCRVDNCRRRCGHSRRCGRARRAARGIDVGSGSRARHSRSRADVGRYRDLERRDGDLRSGRFWSSPPNRRSDVVDFLLQQTVNGIVLGSAYALYAAGFGLVMANLRIFHVAHAAIFTWGAVFAWILTDQFGWSLLAALPVVAVLAGLLDVLAYLLLIRHIRVGEITKWRPSSRRWAASSSSSNSPTTSSEAPVVRIGADAFDSVSVALGPIRSAPFTWRWWVSRSSSWR